MYNDGCKSINVKSINDDRYNVIEIPAIKKRVFMDCDFSIMKSVGGNDD